MTGVIAIGSLIVSIWAIWIAKTEPVRARRRVHRDVVRNALVAASDSLREVATALSNGKDVGKPAESISVALDVIEDFQLRLPESETLMSLEPKFRHLIFVWENANRSEDWLTESQEREASLELRLEAVSHQADRVAVVKNALSEERRDIEIKKRERDASYNELSTKVSVLRESILSYVRILDRNERLGR